MPPAVGGHYTIPPSVRLSVCLSVPWRSCPRLQRPPATRDVRTADPSADGRRSAASRTAISGEGAYRLAALGAITVRCRVSVSHKPVLCRNDWTNRAGIWHGCFLPPRPHCVVRKFRYLQKLAYCPPELFPKLRTVSDLAS